MKITDNRFLVIFSLLILAWALVYQDALVGMEAIWSRSDTFAHGYFILPICLWLLWRDKANLLVSTVQPSWLALPLLAISLFVGLFAYAADISVLSQLSAVTSLIFLLWLLIGNKLAWRYKFPLAYLLFAVPMGENLIPWLQDVTAWFTVFFLKLNGIPVYVDGLYIQIPTGMFEVAVACSGIRYLIASAAVGALYGHLTYKKIHKQIVFFVFSLTLPILANGIRAYGIVAIAYYSDMEYATGADHLIYGWLFFGLIIMLMFWIGGFFADEFNNEIKIPPPSSDKQISSSIYLVPGVSAFLFAVSLYLFQAIPSVNMTEEPINKDVKVNSSWGISFTDSLESSEYTTEKGIDVFHAIYANKQSRGEMISSNNAMHEQDRWTVIATKELLYEDEPVMLVHLRNTNGTSRSYLYQYKVGDFYTVNENKAKLMQAWNSLSRQSDISEIRAISIAGRDHVDLAEQSLLSIFSALTFSPLNMKENHQRHLNRD
ncbi:exosortase A [Colwellia psychrerythraea]|uniref:Exosortase 1 n=1 Tax=Colwellia psychrerythraea TaxID=28229 RepID=A0A099L4I4_COLPS|nr:exosortase A [Colwellia psychrerythraea]KGJ96773.1 exosortase 1 [Colwellia psychrerythraea]